MLHNWNSTSTLTLLSTRISLQATYVELSSPALGPGLVPPRYSHRHQEEEDPGSNPLSARRRASPHASPEGDGAVLDAQKVRGVSGLPEVKRPELGPVTNSTDRIVELGF